MSFQIHALPAEHFQPLFKLSGQELAGVQATRMVVDAKPGFEIAAMALVNINENLEQALYPVKAMLGFYVGGMGAAKRNFHKELMARMGFADKAQEVQDLFMAGKKDQAIAAVPDQFADEISLSGPIDRIREKIRDWEDSPVTSLLVNGDAQMLRQMAEIVL